MMMKMLKNTYCRWGILTGILLLFLPAFFLAGVFLVPCQYDDTFMGELKYKSKLLEEVPGKRIVIVGGSSVAFGVDSELLEKELPEYRVVNFGMYAALGTEAMLELSKPLIREGDIVIISPEQDKQTLSGYFNPEIMWQGIDGDVALLTRFDREHQKQLLGELPDFAVSKWKYWLSGERLQAEGVYNRKSFNCYGDVDSPLCADNKMPGGFDVNTPIFFQEDLVEEEWIQSVNTYTEELVQKGAIVWYRFCPMNELAVEEDAKVDAYFLYLQSKLQCYVIGNPHQSIMEAEWFYDTNFHLNNSGKMMNTYQLIRDIKAMLGDSTATVVELPIMPALHGGEVAAGDDSDALFFNYEEQEGQLWITGLTVEGGRQEELIVPTHYNAKPVVGIASTAFVKQTSIQRIIIQKNIGTIQDGAFAGTDRLREVRLLDVKPENCLVGKALLDGTRAQLVVDQELLSDYKIDYTWSLYAAKLTTE